MASNFTQSLSANRTGCAGCYLRHLCLSADLNDAEIEIFSSHIVSQRRVPKGEVLFRAGAPLDALFVTRLGSFKSSVLTENGERTSHRFPHERRGTRRRSDPNRNITPAPSRPSRTVKSVPCAIANSKHFATEIRKSRANSVFCSEEKLSRRIKTCLFSAAPTQHSRWLLSC